MSNPVCETLREMANILARQGDFNDQKTEAAFRNCVKDMRQRADHIDAAESNYASAPPTPGEFPEVTIVWDDVQPEERI